MRRIATLFAIPLAVALFAARASADAPPTILVDGNVAQTDVPPIVQDGHVLVPLRGVFERLGADVQFDASTNAATVQRGSVTAKVVADSPVAWVNGARVALDAPAREFGGRMEVPLRFIAEALGVAVDFDAQSNTVVLVSGFQPGNFVAAGAGTPPFGASANLQQVTPASVAAAAPSVQDERPTPDELIGTQYPQIYARLGGGSTPVDPATVRVVVDGADVTSQSTVSSAYIAYTPSSAMSDGTHTIEVSGQTQDGTPFDTQWSFRIDSGESYGEVASMVGFAPSPFFGIPRFGFFPPGFSVFAPGPQFFFEDEPIVIVFFSPFFPNGTGFFTVSGFPGQFVMTPWLGNPGFFWGSMSVPGGIFDPDAIVAAHFSTSDGRMVLVHSTAPLHIDGTRRSAPASMHFAVRARLVNRPKTPRSLVAFNRIEREAPDTSRSSFIILRSHGTVTIIHTTPGRLTIIPGLRSNSRPMTLVPRATPVFGRRIDTAPVILRRVMPPGQVIMPRPLVPQPVMMPRAPAPVVIPMPHRPPA